MLLKQTVNSLSGSSLVDSNKTSLRILPSNRVANGNFATFSSSSSPVFNVWAPENNILYQVLNNWVSQKVKNEK